MPTSRLIRTAAMLLLVGITQTANGPLHAQGRDTTRITRAEIATRPGASDALALIRQLRPHFLATGRSEPVVYIDTTRAFSIDDLSTVPSINVQEIRFLTAAEAAGRYGTGRSGGTSTGVILVKTRRQAMPPRRSPEADGYLPDHGVTTHSNAVRREP